MIRHTFSIFKGIGERLERRLWQQGILYWEDFVRQRRITGISPDKKPLYDRQIGLFQEALLRADHRYFVKTVRRREHWRFFDVFVSKAVCLDIETNGLMPAAGGYVTVVGLYDGTGYRCLVRGLNLNEDSLAHSLRDCKLIITFGGTVFDIPYLQRCFSRISFDYLHFDLAMAAKRLGMKGGLKGIEKSFGLYREPEIDGLNGYDAVRLWHLYKKGKRDSLDTLVLYNRADTVNLYRLAFSLYNMLRDSTGINWYLNSV